MEYIEVPEVPVLRGKAAIVALKTYLSDLKSGRSKELTETQTVALTGLVTVLISSIEAETRYQKKVQLHFLSRLKQKLRTKGPTTSHETTETTVQEKTSPNNAVIASTTPVH